MAGAVQRRHEIRQQQHGQQNQQQISDNAQIWRFWLKVTGAGGQAASIECYLSDNPCFFQRF
jgi:hypothetical protein